jgi:molecular chaperone DnaK
MIAGIDLGTTHSLIGVIDSGFPLLIAGADGDRLTPSVVHYTTSGEAKVGREALQFLSTDPKNTIFSVKRLMGSRSGENADGFPYAISATPGGLVQIETASGPKTPEEVSARILAKLKNDAERALGVTVDRAVITVPAYFNDAQRNATKRAGELAGVQVERILSEPTAAALAYGLDRLGEQSKVAVFDLGGGTFDISVLELNAGVFEVRSTHGDTHLGGDDFDRATQQALIAKLGTSVSLSEARACKERLSDQESTMLGEVRITTDELKPVWQPILERTRRHCIQALRDADLTAQDLDRVILVGGSTRMPLVREFVAQIFSCTPDCNQHPDEAVALGAVIQAGVLDGSVQNITLLDVTPLSLGIETFGGLMNVLIPRNTTIPVKQGEMFTNAVANQSAMRIHVLQGEREMARDNWTLGTFDLPFTPAAKGQARVGVQFEIDANGILHVLARDIATGKDQTVCIESAVQVADTAVEEMVGASVENAFADMSERIFTETRIKAEEMIPAVEMALERMREQISTEERERITALVNEVRSAIAAQNTQKLKKLISALDDATQDLATLLLESLMAD